MTTIPLPWASVASMSIVRQTFGCAMDTSGRIYAVGGSTAGGMTSSMERFDATTGAWTTLATMPAGSRNRLGVASDSSGRIYAINGSNPSGTALTLVERFDPATGAWSTLPGAGYAAYFVAAATDASGRVYVFGGTNSGTSALGYLQRFDPSAGTWTTLSALPQMPTARYGHAGASDAAGRIYAIGGITSGTTALATVERFDPATGAWSTLTSMPTPRYYLTAATDAQGRIYAIGGRDGSGSTFATVERFDPATGVWSTLTSMPTARYWLAGGRDSSGRVYALGGSTGTTLATVERATPNVAPNAPTLTSPPNNGAIDKGILQRFGWTPSDPDPGDSQSAFDLQYRLIGAPTWTTVSGTTPNSFYDFAAGTFAAGNYEWQVRTYDSQGVVGPFSPSSFFTAATAPPAPTITAPVNGSTIPNTATVAWSAPNQTGYRIRRVADNAGAANPSIVYYDSGDVADATSRSVTLAFDTNNRWEHLQVRIKNAGLWSAWADARVQVSYTPPTTPTVTLTPINTRGDGYGTDAITVAITNPAPGAGVPATAYNDVLIDDGDGTGLIRKATNLPTNTPWLYRLPRSGFDYSGHIQVRAVGVNGTTATGTA